MSSYEFIKTERQESALIARLSNPPRHLLNAKMVLELGALAREVEEDGSVRSLILTGDAEGTFITHYDVGDLSAASDATREQKPPAGDSEVEFHGMHKLLLFLQEMPSSPRCKLCHAPLRAQVGSAATSSDAARLERTLACVQAVSSMHRKGALRPRSA